MVGWGEPGYYEDWLVGNRKGFAALRDTIDELLAEEVDTLLPEDCECDFQGLSIGASSSASAEGSASGWLFGAGCLLVLSSFLGLIGLGVWKLVELCVG